MAGSPYEVPPARWLAAAGSSYQEARDRVAIEKTKPPLAAVGLAPGWASRPLGDRTAISGGFAMMDTWTHVIFDNIYKKKLLGL